MTENRILETAKGLKRVHELLGKYVQDQALSFEEKRELWCPFLFAFKKHEIRKSGVAFVASCSIADNQRDRTHFRCS